MNMTLKRFHEIAYEISCAHKAMQCDNAEFEVIEKAGAEYKRLAGELDGMTLEDATRTAINAVRPVIRGILGLRTVSMLPVARRYWVGSFSKADFECVVEQWAAVPCELPREAMLAIADATERDWRAATIISHGNRSYSLGETAPVCVSVEEDSVLQAFAARKASLTTSELERHVTNVSRVVGKLSVKFPGAVHRPANKGDGYYIAVNIA